MSLSTIKDIEEKIMHFEQEKSELQILGKKLLDKIKKGAKFGYPDFQNYYEDGGYHPCELLEVIDEEHFIIKIKEISINDVCIVDVFGLYIED